MSKYSIGIDFGTLSARSLIIDLENGTEIATALYEYPHAVMDDTLPCGKKLPANYALQHPMDYLKALSYTVKTALSESNIDVRDIVGLALDFTACTVFPVKKDGTPLCFFDKYKSEPHAYAKLWKHHAAQEQANIINMLAEKMNEPWLKLYGGKLSSEWLFPKLLQILMENPAIFDEMDYFIEAGDWLVWQLTGTKTHNACMSGFKATWQREIGYPSKVFLKALHPKLENVVGTKISENITPSCEKAGEVNAFGADLTGLLIGTPVAVSIIDAHAAMPALKITGSKKMFIIIGTSSCEIVLDENEKIVLGTSGVVKDGVLPGFYAYESGQAAVGDMFDWFVKNCVPKRYAEGNVHKNLREKAKLLKPGESGLLALDWWNGNRSVLVDSDLSGLIIGMNLQTQPEGIYRALLESTAFGARIIIETYEKNGVKVDELIAAGGIAEKDELLMQIYADITNREIRLSGSALAGALGCAIIAAYSGGYFPTMAEASEKLGRLSDKIYKPVPENAAVYQKLFDEYLVLHDYFGRSENSVMKRLLNIKNMAK